MDYHCRAPFRPSVPVQQVQIKNPLALKYQLAKIGPGSAAGAAALICICVCICIRICISVYIYICICKCICICICICIGVYISTTSVPIFCWIFETTIGDKLLHKC